MKSKKSKAWIILEKIAKEELSIREVANMLNMERSETVRRWYIGQVLPDYGSCVKIGKAFNLNPGSIYSFFREHN